MVLKDTATGSIDTLRTNSQGEVLFTGLPLGTSYFQAIGDKEGYKSWDGTPRHSWSTWPNTFIFTTPSSTTNNNDTLFEKQFVLVSDSLFSRLNNIKVHVTDYTIAEMFSRFNVHLGVNDTAYAHIKIASYNNDTLFVNHLKNMQQTLSQNAGIPIVHLDNPFNIQAIWHPPNATSYDPFTTTPRLVGTNFVNGPNVTYAKYYGFNQFPNSPFYGDATIMSCDSITASGTANAWVKEHFRWFGATSVSSRPSVMNVTASVPTDIDYALINMYYHLARNRYQFQVHDLGNFMHLRDSIMLLSVPWAKSITNCKLQITDADPVSDNGVLASETRVARFVRKASEAIRNNLRKSQ